ncbi:peptidylprolyl isomerase [Candidatus Woesearchaeota archaeon]|nr:peptidylprolyl isomerase [Candidatus Woesearchaeota archaeon]MBW3021919.1 peptidylprolyl isomerase [Candidatus Woesearchaeota archaeon]
MEAKEGDTLNIEYTGTFEEGTMFDTNVGKDPLTVKLGEKKLIKGFEQALYGMKPGDEKEITIEPKDAYGERHEELIQKVPKKSFPEKMELKVGTSLSLKDPDGHIILATIAEVSDNDVKIDLNHPFAGKRLKFKIKLLSIG